MEDSDYVVSDEEISTNKERHSRLGEDNLDDTLEYDFSAPPLREKKLKELQTYDVLLPDKATHHEVKAQTDSGLMMDPDILPVSRSPECGISNPYISYKNVADIPETKKAEGVNNRTE
ncbi:hypothetical protein JRQ81_019988 [Phrynocephalus forsythii]|uniref:Uncharacterized protein n=1 Tax=Phrynocephalus forsythii TaxID=171643 RepID=A0A9Q0XPZ5_9SAUR|nr:hypothetical protein JRQ81_019988 [Phrynocephalus forsythii]